jgi:hypothetical protein
MRLGMEVWFPRTPNEKNHAWTVHRWMEMARLDGAQVDALTESAKPGRTVCAILGALLNHGFSCMMFAFLACTQNVNLHLLPLLSQSFPPCANDLITPRSTLLTLLPQRAPIRVSLTQVQAASSNFFASHRTAVRQADRTGGLMGL